MAHQISAITPAFMSTEAGTKEASHNDSRRQGLTR